MLYFNEASDKEITKVLEELHTGWETCHQIVRGIFGRGTDVDEMAILSPSDSKLFAFLERAVQREGYELFNTASDTVSTQPIPSVYNVAYYFLRTPYPYRIELMNLQSGYSPLHSQHEFIQGTANRTGYLAVHASFKCPNEDAYLNAQVKLRQEGFELAQRCDSSYGKFSYHTNLDSTQWYLKPRVNLRDRVSDDA